MKKIAVLLVSAFLILGMVTNAQNSVPFKVDAGKFDDEINAGEKTSINAKVISNFDKMFAGASNVIWSKEKNLNRVYFESNGKTTRATFNQKGQFLYSISTYGEQLLPKDILFRVKDTYYGKNIFGVTEVKAMDKTAYIIILEDKTSWLHVKVLDGEMTEEKVYLKAQ